MAVAELFIGAFISLLFQKLTSPDFIKLARSVGIHPKLKKWSSTLTLINAVLVDAGQKQVRDTSVQLWLNELQHLVYEIDDVLDDLVTEATRHELNKKSQTSTSTSKVIIKFIPNKLHTLKHNRKMSSKLNEITTKLLDLVKEKQLLGLIDKVETSVRASYRRLEETSLVDESKIIGREGDKEALLSKLLGSDSSSSQSQNVNVISIVGLGGIGKTTLAQLMYNDEKVKGHFELKAWVCVSDVFDVFNISKALFQAVNGRGQDFANLNLLQEALSEKLSKKKFLLVLDDVWNENYNDWESLQRPFMVGDAGSIVLVTTRKSMVASVMDSVEACSLELLSNEEAFSLFAQHASSRQNFDVNQTLKMHGEDIIKKCGGLPLALRTLGRVFRTKSNVEEWEELLNSNIWNSHNESEILPALKLSYYDLPPHLKRMFVYCCLFPKDYKFNKEELILLWMAEGFLYESNGYKSMESFGHECFEELLSRSLFQHITGDDSHYTMHDLINDLATSVAGEFFLVLDDKTDVHARIEASEKFHHLSFIGDANGADKKFKALKNCKHLRTLLAMLRFTRLPTWLPYNRGTTVLRELLPQLQLLRVLSLAGYIILEVPQLVCSLKHLRYLNFSNTEIACLPEQFGDLLNLQSLLVSGCRYLSSFPSSFVKLINLRHLDISNTPRMNKKSLGIGGLSGLQSLSKIVIGKNNVFGISDLKGQLTFQGELSITGLHEVKDAAQAKEAKLQQRKENCDLLMEWCDQFDDSRDKATEFKVLEGLRPSEKLRSLKILYYGGTEFPSWVGDPSFVCLTSLILKDCESCKRLPAFGQLPSLREFIVDHCDNIESIPDFLPYRCLKSLKISYCKNMKSFPFKDLQSLASLERMEIINCPSLDESFPCGLWPRNLSVLRIGGLKKPMSKWGFQNFPTSLVKLYLYGEYENSPGGVTFAKDWLYTITSSSSVLLLPSSLTELWISDFKELESVREGLQHLTRLQHLEIVNCPKVRDLPETILPSLSSLTLLGDVSQELKIKCSRSREGEYWPLISQIPNLNGILCF